MTLLASCYSGYCRLFNADKKSQLFWSFPMKKKGLIKTFIIPFFLVLDYYFFHDSNITVFWENILMPFYIMIRDGVSPGGFKLFTLSMNKPNPGGSGTSSAPPSNANSFSMQLATLSYSINFGIDRLERLNYSFKRNF